MTDNLYYGTNVLNNEEIYINRKKNSCPNALYAGAPGSGLMFAVNHEIAQVYTETEDDIVFVGNPNDVRCISGFEVYRINEISEETINPLDIVVDTGDVLRNDITVTLGFDKGFDVCRNICMIFLHKEIDPAETKLLYDAYRSVMTPFIDKLREENVSYKPEENPTFLDVLSKIGDSGFKDDLLTMTGTHVLGDGKLVNPCLSQRTNVGQHKRVCLYVGQTFIDDAHEKVNLLAALNYAVNRVYLNNQKRAYTWLYLSFDSKEMYYQMLCSQCVHTRMFYGITTYIFSNGLPEDVHEFYFSKIMNSSQTSIFTRLNDIDTKHVIEMYDISEPELFKTPGIGMISNGSGIMPFKLDSLDMRKE